MYVILVGPDGQVVRYDGQAIPRGEALRAFLAHGWRPGSRRAVTPEPEDKAAERLEGSSSS
jgi:hypothetical protein